ncbi:family 78 glycoside hydrolase catalytic domain [Lewinella sp. JB7]|uniref:family 78 glycoside hydrolase catalytic domain n=1 Tax=Lewinella sp. JB7 TaxID=2962887 RepID=UPI0020C98E10|nr:family 78 glycoside hydrolase catalytic domain [Lewinella sp. JB7]MCP9236185.1 glycoside hydrolase family 78 protein [Lewinella sp. JB7]
MHDFKTSVYLFLILLLACVGEVTGQITVENLRVEQGSEPLALETETPRFSWRMKAETDRRGVRQTAYRIRVRNEAGEEVWNSGKVADDESLYVPYAGASLQPTTRYKWALEVWADNGETAANESFFETALTLDGHSASEWNGAQWIGGGEEDLVLFSPYLSVFRLEYGIQLDEASGSTRAAFLFGGNDARWMNRNKNLFGMENERDQAYLALELDVSALDAETPGPARLHIYRAGYTADDQPDRPLLTYEIPITLIDATNRYATHRVYLDLVFGEGNLYLDGTSPEHRLNAETFTVNPYGKGGDYISAPMVGEVGYWVEPGQSARFSEVAVRNYRQPSNVLARLPDVEFSTSGSRQLQLTDPSRNAAPLLRTEFTAPDRAIEKARLYVTARGIYEVYLNGERVGEEYFNPGLTQYNKTHFYQTYDVTDRIRPGEANVLGAWLSEGWWSGNITFRGENWNYFGDRQSLLAKLVITFSDGTEYIITSNDTDWKLFTDGPIRYGSFFQGEIYDARREAAITDWSEPGYDDSDWKSAVEVPLEGTTLQGSFRDFLGREVRLNYDSMDLRSQIGENVTIVETLTAQSVEEVRPGVFLYDLGQNMVGFPRITLHDTRPSDTITLRYAEMRYPQLPEYTGNEGMVMIENLRAALIEDRYITRGGLREVIQPRFTFHGYRYLEITGIDEALPLTAVEGRVLSSVKELASHYETSNPLVNRLWENITWSLRGNFLSIPTDTPARNERMGWNGDINVFSRAATWLADIGAFLERHALAMRDMQGENGRFTDVAPVGGGFGGTIWGSAGLVMTWENYRQFGDLEALRDHYPAMQRYVKFLQTRFDDGILTEGPLGDWLSPENGKNDNSMLWAAYYGYDLKILAAVAAALGEAEQSGRYERQFADFREEFNARYVDPETSHTLHQGVVFNFRSGLTTDSTLRGKRVDTQASYAIPLAFGLFTDGHRGAAGRLLAESVERTNIDDGGVARPPYSLMTGFIGTASIAEALSQAGRDDLAYRLLQQETYPSWLYPVKNGATTIWERLNSYTHDDGFGGNNNMNSFNHYSFGAVATWMYNHSLGIRRDPERPGFKHFLLSPTPDPTGKMTYARGHYDSPYGRIESEWSTEEEAVSYRIVVPPNTTATLSLLAKDVSTITEGGLPATEAEAVTARGHDGDRQLFELAAGSYDFRVSKR